MASTMPEQPAEERYLRPGQVAKMFGVLPRAVLAWGEARHLTVLRTLGGHRRYKESEVLRIKAQRTTPAQSRA